MENLFYEEIFFSDLSDVMDYYDIGEDELDQLEDDWKLELHTSKLEPMFQLTEDFVLGSIMEKTDIWEERFPEECDRTLKELMDAIKSGIDIEKINENIPKVFYPSGGKIIVTKQDLIDWCK